MQKQPRLSAPPSPEYTNTQLDICSSAAPDATCRCVTLKRQAELCIGILAGAAHASVQGWLGAGGEAAMDSGLADPLQHAGSREWHLACNWKVFCDNYLVRDIVSRRWGKLV